MTACKSRGRIEVESSGSGGGELGRRTSSAGGKFWWIIIGASNQQFVWSAKLGKKSEGGREPRRVWFFFYCLIKLDDREDNFTILVHPNYRDL